MINRRRRLSKSRARKGQLRSVVWGHRNQNRLGRNDEIRGQAFESSKGVDNPCPMLFNLALVGLIQGLEHVDVPLSELMHPFGDQMHAIRVPNHVVKTTLKRKSQYQKNKEIIKRKNIP